MTTICTDQLTPPVNDATGHAATEEISLYYAIGGRRSLVAAVEDFYDRLFADPEIVPFFPEGVTARHQAYLVTVLGEALGGPERYRGPDLAQAHPHLSITDHHFNLVAGHLDATLEAPRRPPHPHRPDHRHRRHPPPRGRHCLMASNCRRRSAIWTNDPLAPVCRRRSAIWTNDLLAPVCRRRGAVWTDDGGSASDRRRREDGA